MSAPNAFSSTIVSYTTNPDYTRMEGFKAFKTIYNKRNNHTAHNDPNTPYPLLEVIYNQVKNSGCFEREFKDLSLQDFVITGSISAQHQMKCLSLVPYYQAQMEHFTQKWDTRDNQGEGTEVIYFCCQAIRVVATGLHHLMANVLVV